MIKDWLAKNIINNHAALYNKPAAIQSPFLTNKIIGAVSWAFKKADRFSSDQRENMILADLNNLINHAHSNIAFWRKRLDKAGVPPGSIKSLSNLSNIPILTREDLKAVREPNLEYYNKNYKEGRLIFTSTSGSTGKPLRVVHDKVQILLTRTALFKLLANRGAFDLHGKNYSLIETADEVNGYMKNSEFFYYNSDATEGDVKNLMKTIEKALNAIFHPSVHQLLLLAKTAESKKLPIKFSGILVSSDYLPRECRPKLEALMRAPIYTFYGCRELGPLASECRNGSGFHLMPGIIMEIIDNYDNVLPAGKTGHIIVTGLYNYATPFIRYKIGDVGKFLAEPCRCGINTPRLIFEGRNDWHFIRPDGVKVPYLEVKTVVFFDLPFWFKIKQFQFVQESFNCVRLYILPGASLDKKEFNLWELLIQKKIRNLLMGVQFEVILTKDLIYQGSGKPKEFISKIKKTLLL